MTIFSCQFSQVLLAKIEAAERNYPHLVQDLIEAAIDLIKKLTKEHGLFMSITVESLLFGYNDTLLLDFKKLLEDFPFLADKVHINPFFGLEVSLALLTGFHTGWLIF